MTLRVKLQFVVGKSQATVARILFSSKEGQRASPLHKIRRPIPSPVSQALPLQRTTSDDENHQNIELLTRLSSLPSSMANPLLRTPSLLPSSIPTPSPTIPHLHLHLHLHHLHKPQSFPTPPTSRPLRFRRPAPRSTPFVASSNLAVDSVVAAPLASLQPKVLPFRVGHGFDLHRLEPGYPLIIGGIDIPHDRGCEAHSDGDVLLHCVVDAILGALGLPDIGQIFPDNDPKWKGAPSAVFVAEAVRLMHEAGYEIGNLDATLILQRPKISPHKENIRANLAKLLGADLSVVNLKAKTHEKVDSLGENRSIAAHTVILLMKK
ncbi:hypothetical protein MLD38_013932 [Melastoma candidum]|uniref:Uncharacterized protein n=1 Tax=Melastoma candidum TaxID=119954 RepID=A0ACB9RAI8_9MYRT|nr:hypothetical protein MLD38_013932 [Melastoma candidum]